MMAKRMFTYVAFFASTARHGKAFPELGNIFVGNYGRCACSCASSRIIYFLGWLFSFFNHVAPTTSVFSNARELTASVFVIMRSRVVAVQTDNQWGEDGNKDLIPTAREKSSISRRTGANVRPPFVTLTAKDMLCQIV